MFKTYMRLLGFVSPISKYAVPYFFYALLYALFNRLFGYTAANSWQYANGEPKVATPIWKTAMYVAWGVTAVLVIGLEIVAIKRYLNRKKAVATVESAAEPVAAGPANAE